MKSIRVRMMIQVVVTITVLLIAFGYYNYTSTRDQLISDLNQRVEAVQERLKISLPGPIWDYAPEFISKNIESEMSTPAIAGLKVTNQDNEQLSIVARLGQDIVLNKEGPTSSTYTREMEVKLFYDDDGEMQPVGKAILYINERVIDPALERTMSQAIIQAVVMDLFVAFVVLLLLTTNVMTPLGRITTAINDIARGEGDLTKRLDDSKGDEISELATGFNQFVEQLQEMVRNVSKRADQLQGSSQQTSTIVDDTNRGVSEQQTKIDMVATATSEMSQSIASVADNAGLASQAAQDATNKANNGGELVNHSISAINSLADEIGLVTQATEQLNEESNNIGMVLDVIKNISDQTNLLALNAAIEAARAGEAGRGFAVVAEEVRNLALKTTQSTEEINNSIFNLRSSTDLVRSGIQKLEDHAKQGAEKVGLAGASLEEILSAIDQINQMNAHIAEASGEQSQVISEINENIVNIASVADQTVRNAEQTLQKSSEVEGLSSELQSMMTKFKY